MDRSPYDMNGSQFNPDMFLQKLLKEHTLKEIMDQEDIIVKETQGLHSDMQTLVYENYNKFISATDTIRKMKVDFKKMEAEMDSLGKNMDSITTCSDKISTTLQKTRGQISKLSGVHALLKRLQFLFKLPAKLNSLMDEEKYAQAVEDYLRTQQVLHHYSHLESFLGIQEECNAIVADLKDRLHNQYKNPKLFIQPDRSFTAENEFLQNFSLNCVRTGLVVEFLKHIVRASVVFTKPIASPSLPTLLVLAKMCMEFSSSHIHYLIGLVDEWFNIKLTKEREDEEEELTRLMEGGAQDLVNHYVRMQGNIISQMVRKSIETRDWCQSLEPRTVRPVIKRILEELATSDTCLGSLFEEGERPSQPGSASRHHRSMVSGGSAVWSSGSTQSYTHNLNKLFSDKIEIYSPVSLTKTSVLTGVIKIALKLFTFGSHRYGQRRRKKLILWGRVSIWHCHFVFCPVGQSLNFIRFGLSDGCLMASSCFSFCSARSTYLWKKGSNKHPVISCFQSSLLFGGVQRNKPRYREQKNADASGDQPLRYWIPSCSLGPVRQAQAPQTDAASIVSTGCLIAVRVGSLISSSALLYLLVMAVLTVPGFVKHALPPKLKQRILETVRTVAAVVVPADVNVDEYLPDATTEENVALLNRAGNNCDLSPPSSDDSSIADLLIPGVEDSLDATDNFLPTIPQESESRESSDSEDALRFRPTHFNGSTTKGAMPAHDDSTDDEGSLLKELDFSSVNPATTPSKAGLSGLTDIVASALYRTVPKAFTPANSVFKKLDNDDSDSDFEIIENDDAS
ncbi:unnamed protein product [Nesidiocoris tenuis]|uniref:Vacuolar protein sorting-associated protein 51 homolog n=1 Tax=Nesidiocoris tenuis TaxID=355587 RepID=A0A6H5HMH7_9HEMI|nr:unnamed protein product [Nesidiocoris tenuis]